MRRLSPLLLSLAALAGGCALNLNEARPARVLRGGEMEISQVSSVVLPTAFFTQAIDAADQSARAVTQGEEVDEAQRRSILRAAVLSAVHGPGYDAQLQFGLGLGYRFDVSARLASGIYGLSVRRGFDLGLWDGSLGARLLYNTGSSTIPYVDDINDVLSVADTQRLDSQLFASVGREWGEWGRLWFGAKGMHSIYRVDVEGDILDTGDVRVTGQAYYLGGFVGLALGFRYLFVVAEIMALYSWGGGDIGGRDIDLDTPVLVPSWGLRGTF